MGLDVALADNDAAALAEALAAGVADRVLEALPEAYADTAPLEEGADDRDEETDEDDVFDADREGDDEAHADVVLVVELLRCAVAVAEALDETVRSADGRGVTVPETDAADVKLDVGTTVTAADTEAVLDSVGDATAVGVVEAEGDTVRTRAVTVPVEEALTDDEKVPDADGDGVVERDTAAERESLRETGLEDGEMDDDGDALAEDRGDVEAVAEAIA